jgi:thioredoxin 1
MKTTSTPALRARGRGSVYSHIAPMDWKRAADRLPFRKPEEGGDVMNSKEPCAVVDNETDLGEILRAKESVIALFYASWCPYCKKFLPVFMKNAEEERRHFLGVRDDQESLADKYSVKIYPTVLFIEKGDVSKRLDGIPGVGLQEKHLVEFVRSCPLP